MEKMSDRIRHARKKTGLRQADLAKILGISTASVGQYEVGSANPSVEKLIKISEACKVSVDWLTKGIDLKSKSADQGAFGEQVESRMLREENQYLKDRLKEAMEIIRNASLGKAKVTDSIAGWLQAVTSSVTQSPKMAA